jgi:hypothetical protein
VTHPQISILQAVPRYGNNKPFQPPTIPSNLPVALPTIQPTASPPITRSLSISNPNNRTTNLRHTSESGTASNIAHSRNMERVSSTTQLNRSILGKSTPHLSLNDCIPPPLHLPPVPMEPNPQLLTNIVTIRQHPTQPMQPPPFRFDMSQSAEAFNTALLRHHSYDVHRIITMDNTICTPGIEFKPTKLLDLLFHRHSLWPFARNVLSNGAELSFLHDIDDTQRQLENDALINFNSHNKAKLHNDIVHDSIATDVSYGFAAPILINSINDIPGSMVCPLGIAQQTTLSPEGLRIPKNRLTHDQTFSVLETSQSVNKTLNIKAYPDLIYGFCLRWIIYQVLALRHHFPNQSILIAKYDIKQAFRRVHYSGSAATKCIAVFEEIAYLQLRMTFGGSNCPTTWCSISKLIADLSNDIIDSSDWDPTTLHWDHQHLVPPKSYLDSNIPFATCLPTLLLPPPKPQGSVDIYINDAITTCLDTPDYTTRSAAALPLAVDVMARPYDSHDKPKREHMLALSKLNREVRARLGRFSPSNKTFPSTSLTSFYRP